MTPHAQWDALMALHEKSTPGEWSGYRLVHEGRDDMTPEEVGEYVKNSVIKSATESGTTDFIAILATKEDGPADVAHMGNGPTSPQNAAFIVAAHNSLPALAAEYRRMVEALDKIAAMKRDDRMYPFEGCQSIARDALRGAKGAP